MDLVETAQWAIVIIVVLGVATYLVKVLFHR